jgi:alkylhydroperoxidase family enzyme
MTKRGIDFVGDVRIAAALDHHIERGMHFSTVDMVRSFFMTAVYLFRDRRFNGSVYLAGKVPTVKDICEQSAKLGYSVQLTLTPAKTCKKQAVLNHTFPEEFDHNRFLCFMRIINAFGKPNPHVSDLAERARLLKLFCNPRFSPRWHHLMRFAWLCGYLFECRPVPSVVVEPSAEDVISPE